MQDAVLAAFLIIDNELHRNAGFARPNGPRPVAAITDQIARISCSMSNKPLCSQEGSKVNLALYTKSC
jgi:hypothetical protein